MRWGLVVAGWMLAWNAAGQTRPQPLFDPSGMVWNRTGWSVGVGVLGLHPEPRQWEAQWIRGGDTLYTGEWTARGGWGFGGEVARWRVLETPVLIDRWQVRAGGGFRQAGEQFEGVVQGAVPDTLEGTARHGVASLGLHGLRAFPLTNALFVEGMMGVGMDAWFLRREEPAGPDSLFRHPAPGPPFRWALEAGVGLGYALPKGGFLRLTLEADLLQLSPASRAGGSRVDLLQQGYRPWSLLLRWDFRRPRPEIDCSGPPDPKQPGRDLFDPKMRKRYRYR